MRKTLLTTILVLCPFLAIGAAPNDMVCQRIGHTLYDLFRVGHATALNDTWTCAAGSETCTADTSTGNATSLTGGDIVDINGHTYSVKSTPSGDNTFLRDQTPPNLCNTGENMKTDALVAVAAGSSVYVVNTGLHATTLRTIYDGAGNATTRRESQSGFQLFGSSATDVLALRLDNEDQPASGETTQTVQQSFYLQATSDSGSTYAAVEAGRIELYKVSDHYNAAGTGDNDSGFKIYTANNGSITERINLTNAGVFTLTGTFTNNTNDWYLPGSNNGLKIASDTPLSWVNNTSAALGTGDIVLSRYTPDAGTTTYLELDQAGTASDGTGTGRLLLGLGSSSELALAFGAASGDVGFYASSTAVIHSGSLASVVGTLGDTDTTPDVSGGNIWWSQSNTGATEITDLDNPVVGTIYTLCVGDANNAPTITDGGNFNISGNWSPGLDDCIGILVQADNDYVEAYRSDN